tara:strand:+ start:1050 stop:1217 length:168 start_codon:yes stop_codon:yes gene_type:complete
MRLSEAKKLINEELSKLFGFKSGINADYQFLCIGVKTGQITAKDAAKRAFDAAKF